MSMESRLTLDSPNVRGYVRKHPPVVAHDQAVTPAKDQSHEHRPPRSRLVYDRHKLRASRRLLADAGTHFEAQHHKGEKAVTAIRPSDIEHSRQPDIQEFALPEIAMTKTVAPETIDYSTDMEEFPDDIPIDDPTFPKKLIGYAAGKAKGLLSSAGRHIRKAVVAVAGKPSGIDQVSSTSFLRRIWHERALALRICLIAITVSLVSVGVASYQNFYKTHQMTSQAQPFIPDPELVGSYNVVNRNETAVLEATADNYPSAPSDTPISPADIKAYSVEADLPRIVTIPSIGAKTIIKSISRNDILAAIGPSNVFEVNWFEESAKPASLTGAMLLTGYYSGPTGEGIFHDLDKVQIGDNIQIEGGDGTVYNFQVIESLFYNLGDTDMTKAVTSADRTKLGLNLMTCDGDYDVATKTYEHRLLVRAVKISHPDSSASPPPPVS